MTVAKRWKVEEELGCGKQARRVKASHILPQAFQKECGPTEALFCSESILDFSPLEPVKQEIPSCFKSLLFQAPEVASGLFGEGI